MHDFAGILSTYSSVELVLALASVNLRHKVDRAATSAFGLRI
jgi:hypothetical protein